MLHRVALNTFLGQLIIIIFFFYLVEDNQTYRFLINLYPKALCVVVE